MIEKNIIKIKYELVNEYPHILVAAFDNDLEKLSIIVSENPSCINDAEPDTLLTALHIAAGNGSYSMSKFLCDQPNIDIGKMDAFGRTPYLLADIIGRNDISDMILARTHAINEAQNTLDENGGDNLVQLPINAWKPQP